MPRPGRQPIVDLLKPLLKERGFAKERQNWRRTEGDFIHVFNLQSGAHGDYYFFNAGIYFRTLGDLQKPTEDQCGVRKRLDSHLRTEPDNRDVLRMDRGMRWEVHAGQIRRSTLEEAAEMPWEERAGHIRRLALEGVAWLERMSSREAILQVIEDRKRDKHSHPGVSVCREGYEYVGIPLQPPKPITTVTLMTEGVGETVNVNDKAAIRAWAKKIAALKPLFEAPSKQAVDEKRDE